MDPEGNIVAELRDETPRHGLHNNIGTLEATIDKGSSDVKTTVDNEAFGATGGRFTSDDASDPELEVTNYRFTGQRADSIGGTTHHEARDLNGASRVWLQTDQYLEPTKDQRLSTSVGDMNRQQYAAGNPVNNTDETGHHYCNASGTGGKGGWHVTARKKKKPNKGMPTAYKHTGKVVCNGSMSMTLKICVQKGDGAGQLIGSKYACGWMNPSPIGNTITAASNSFKCNSTNSFAGVYIYSGEVQIGDTTHIVASPPGGAIRGQRFLNCAV